MLSVFKKEIACYAGSPVLYAIGAVFTAFAGYLFYGNLVMLLLLQGSGLEVNLWEFTVNDIRLLAMLLVPIMTMRMLAEEKHLGTLELLLTSPLRVGGIVAGKYLAVMCTSGLLVSSTLIYPCLVSLFFPVHFCPIFGAYAGLFLLCCAMAAAGMFFSALTDRQLLAAVASAGFLFFLWFIGQNAGMSTHEDVWSFSSLSLQKHFYCFKQGVVTVRGALFFAGFSAFFLLLTVEAVKLRTRASSIPPVSRLCAWGSMFVLCVFQPGIPNVRFDLTPGRMYTPAAYTQAAFSRLRSPFVLTVGCEGLQKYQYEDFFEQLAALSPWFRYRIIPLEKNPAAASLMEITQSGAGFAEYNGLRKAVEKVNEQSVADAVLELTGDVPRKIIILSEDHAGTTKDDFAFRACDSMLEKQGFVLQRSGLDFRGGIDADAGLVMIRDLGRDLPETTLAALRDYFEKGGRVLMLLSCGDMPNAADFLKSCNIDLGNDYIIDREHAGAGFDAATPVIFFNKEHPAAAGCTVPAVFPHARSVQVGTKPRAGYAVSIICFSGRGTWAETDTASALRGDAAFDSGTDTYGPVAVGVSVETQAKSADGNRGRMIVLGSAGFMADSHMELLGNAGFTKKMLSWLTERELPCPVQPKQDALYSTSPIRINEVQDRILFWTVVVIVPALFALAGVGVYLNRRFCH